MLLLRRSPATERQSAQGVSGLRRWTWGETCHFVLARREAEVPDRADPSWHPHFNAHE